MLVLRVSRLLGILFYFAFSTITNTVYAETVETAETKQEPIVQENKTADSPKIKVKVYSKTFYAEILTMFPWNKRKQN